MVNLFARALALTLTAGSDQQRVVDSPALRKHKNDLTILSRNVLDLLTREVVSRFEEHPEEAMLSHLQTAPAAPFHGSYLFRSVGQSGEVLFMGYDESKWLRELATWITFIGYHQTDAHIFVVGSVDPHHTLPRIFGEFPSNRVTILGFQQSDQEILKSMSSSQDPILLVGYASALRRIAEWQQAGLLTLTVAGIYSCADTLTAADRRSLLALWGVTPKSLLSCTEVGTIATTCQYGVFHPLDDRVLMWSKGQVLCSETSKDSFLSHHIMNVPLPFTCSRVNGCPCDQTRVAFRLEHAREIRFLSLPVDGCTYKIHPIAIRSALDSTKGLRSLQIVQKGDQQIEILFNGTASPRLVHNCALNAIKRLVPVQLPQDAIIVQEVP
jgi:hypothetical protein